jgi:hypothetical protein
MFGRVSISLSTGRPALLTVVSIDRHFDDSDTLVLSGQPYHNYSTFSTLAVLPSTAGPVPLHLLVHDLLGYLDRHDC